MTAAPQPDTARGIDFPLDGATRSTTAATKAIVVDAARVADPALADQISAAKHWRDDYVQAFSELTHRSAQGRVAPVEVARAGLDSGYRRLSWRTADAEIPLLEAAADLRERLGEAGSGFGTRTVTGVNPPADELEIPHAGERLSGERLKDQLRQWREQGIAEQSFVDAIVAVADHPEWLSLPGKTVALLGASAEMGALEPLTRWGANILAIDLPAARERIEKLAEAGAGTVRIPEVDGVAGADLSRQPDQLTRWIVENADAGAVTLAMHAYADRGAHVTLTLGADLIAQGLSAAGQTVDLAYLGTPTDAYVVPAPIVSDSQHQYRHRGAIKALQAPLRAVTRGKSFALPYPRVYADGISVADSLVQQQGPNYATAKRIQRWRALVAQADGQRVSFTVAPATWTRSVTKNKVLAGIYAGAHHFGVKVFDSETARYLMAAKLVHDLYGERQTSGIPEAIFSDGALHGGLWRAGYEPRSALGYAYLFGAAKRRPR